MYSPSTLSLFYYLRILVNGITLYFLGMLQKQV
jgi:hypothetical protein